MSQMLAHGIGHDNFLFQDLYFSKKKQQVKSTVKEAACIICDKSLDEGVSVTAKKMGQKLRFFCQYHFPKEY